MYLKKEDLVDLLEKYYQKLISQLPAIKGSENDVDCNPKIRRLNTRQIKEMLGIGDATFEKVQDSLPLHRTKSGRMFAHGDDLIVHLFREHPPYFDFSRFNDYIKEKTS